MRLDPSVLRTAIFAIALALALGGAASAAQVVHGSTGGATVRVAGTSTPAQNDDGDDRDDEDGIDGPDGQKGHDERDQNGQIGRDQLGQSGEDEQGQHGQEGESEGEHQD